MKKFIIEREIPAIGSAEHKELRAVARTSNEDIKEFGSEVQWVASYVTAHKTFCVYLATSEEILRKYAAASRFPADEITEITQVIDPTTALP